MKRRRIFLAALFVSALAFAAIGAVGIIHVQMQYDADGHLEFRESGGGTLYMEIRDGADGVLCPTKLEVNHSSAFMVANTTWVDTWKYNADPNATTAALTCTGVAASDNIIATLNSSPANGAYLLNAVPTSDTVTMAFSADPGTTVTVAVMAFRGFGQ